DLMSLRTEFLKARQGSPKFQLVFISRDDPDRVVFGLHFNRPPLAPSARKITDRTTVARRRRFSTDLKLAVVAETMQPGMSISYVARRHGLSPSLVFRWRRLMSEGGRQAVRADDEVVPAAELRRLEERVRDLERLLGR